MSETERSLLDAVLISPHDDGPRLVYADWLDENGEPERAEYIRCEIAIERWANTPSNKPGGTAEDGGPAGAALATADGLFERHGRKWAPKIPGVKFRWKRGFISGIECDFSTFIGGTCGRCEFGRMVFVESDGTSEVEQCRYCKGYGYHSGLVGVLGCQFPITSVVLPDREPIRLRDNRNRINYGWGNYPTHGRYYVPEKLWKKLKGFVKTSHIPRNIKRFLSEKSAKSSLSDACASMLRECAGLPPLHPIRSIASRASFPAVSLHEYLNDLCNPVCNQKCRTTKTPIK